MRRLGTTPFVAILLALFVGAVEAEEKRTGGTT